MRLRLAALLAVASLMLAVPGSARAADTYTINKPHTILAFWIDRGGLTRMLGRFTEMEGTIILDEANPQASSIEISIATRSVYSGFQRRDDHLRSPDFFNAGEFPEMTFKSTGVKKTGDKTAAVTGDLTLLGVTREVTLEVTLNKIAPNERRKKIFAGFSATGKIMRSDFGMKYGAGYLGEEVDLHFEILTERPM